MCALGKLPLKCVRVSVPQDTDPEEGGLTGPTQPPRQPLHNAALGPIRAISAGNNGVRGFEVWHLWGAFVTGSVSARGDEAPKSSAPTAPRWEQTQTSAAELRGCTSGNICTRAHARVSVGADRLGFCCCPGAEACPATKGLRFETRSTSGIHLVEALL